MARNLDVIMDLAFIALRAGAQAATVIGLLQDVELPEHADEPPEAGPTDEDVMNQWRRGGSGPGLAGAPGVLGKTAPDYRGEVGQSDSGLTGPQGEIGPVGVSDTGVPGPQGDYGLRGGPGDPGTPMKPAKPE